MAVEPTDFDVYVNVATTESHFEEAIYFASLLRKNWRTSNTLESSYHAMVRLALENKVAQKVLPLLEDRRKYGLFPDTHAINMLLDHFIERKEYLNAVEIAKYLMLQEDNSNEISNTLCLYSIYKALENQKDQLLGKDSLTEEGEDEENPSEGNQVKVQEDDEEEEYERVPYIPNEYFDDHFDLKDPVLLMGKSLHFFGSQLDNTIGRTSQIVGLAFYQKWDKAIELTEKFKKDNPSNIFAKNTDELVAEAVQLLPESNEEAKRLQEIIQGLTNSYPSEDIFTLINDPIKKIPSLESKDITAFKEILVKWNEDRETAIKKKLEEYLREEAIIKIRKIKKELEEKERNLYFFENEDKHMLELAGAKKKLSERKLEELEEEYFPPKVESSASLRKKAKPKTTY